MTRIILQEVPHPAEAVTKQLQMINTALTQAHQLFEQEYNRQAKRYQEANGRAPYWRWEQQSVYQSALNAMPPAVRNLIDH